MRFRLPQLSPQARRRLQRWRARVWFWVSYPFQLVGTFFLQVGRLLAEWWERRNLRYLLQGLPAVAAFVGLATLAAVIAFQDRSLLANQYQIQAQRSVSEAAQLLRADKDATAPLALAQTCFQRLGWLQPDRAENRYGLATVLELLKQPAAADAVIRSLAPADRPGYGRAHIWQADRLWQALQAPPKADGERPKTAEMVRAYEGHLLHALQWKDNPEVPTEANVHLFNLYRLMNRLPEAEQALTAAAERRPEMRLVLAGWNLDLGRKDVAKRHAQAAADVFRKRLDDAVDDHATRGQLIRCLLVTGDFQAAEELVLKGTALAKDPAMVNAYRRELARVMLAWYDTKTADPRATHAERYALLDQVMAVAPDSPELLQRLVTFVRQSGPEAEQAKKKFAELTAAGAPSATAHLVLGIDAWQHDKPDEARFHWEMAFKLSPGSPQVANNLAWILAHYPPVDLARAEDLIDAALKQLPQDPRMHGTRGHILLKQGRYKEALPSLELSKAVYTNDPKLFQALAECCGKLGMDRMAADYTARAEALTAKAPPAAPALPGAAPKPAAPDAKGVPASELVGPPAPPAGPKPGGS
jgi:predicted Zn-dependent protease